MELQRADHIGPLDMFKIGIGPSSSHTMGPMVAARAFRKSIEDHCSEAELSEGDWQVTVDLFGSLSATGKGHATDGAVCAGLAGLHVRENTPDEIWATQNELKKDPWLNINGARVAFDPDKDLLWRKWRMNEKALPHPNTMRFRLLKNDQVVLEDILVSVGGGFVEKAGALKDNSTTSDGSLPNPYNTAADFVNLVNESGKPAWQIVLENEEARGTSEAELRQELQIILDTIDGCIERGLSTEGILPGGLNVKRRAKSIYDLLQSGSAPAWTESDLRPSVYAMAVNEENAAGGRVVTAPTNGASGLIPGVFRTLKEIHGLSNETLQNGLIVASVIGALVKVHASISGAEVGCQGEVGTSCAMAAAAAVAMLGGTANQIEQAAEIGIEHHLGMTCDPIMGLVQVPCIERNAMGAVKALNAAALSLASDGTHLVSLDKALSVMKQTGLDMNKKYKETSTGGLALG
ncbi:MAG: L-serine ammonia-lyase [Candidatus Obscuribacterales bacterium]|nr:L-serine ammonia-lyase [Candidatus Obscuribacterales bacterium]